jgi:hypothetical protein
MQPWHLRDTSLSCENFRTQKIASEFTGFYTTPASGCISFTENVIGAGFNP